MSVTAMSWVWHRSSTRGNARLVLLAIADHANDDGENAFPSLATIAHKCGGIDESTVRRILRYLEGIDVKQAKGQTQKGLKPPELRVERNAGGKESFSADRRPNRYTILLKHTPDRPRAERKRASRHTREGADCTPVHDQAAAPARGRSSARDDQAAAPARGRSHAPLTIHEPTEEPPTQPRPARTPAVPDPVFEALTAAFRLDTTTLTSIERQRLAAAVKQLRAVDAAPDEIAQRAAAYRHLFPHASFTPMALVGRWSECEPRRAADLLTTEIVSEDANSRARVIAQRQRRERTP